MPAPTTNLIARFLASTGKTVSGGRVTAWADQSGNGLDAAQGTNAPYDATDAYTGLPVVRFDGQTVNGPASMVFGTGRTFTARNIAVFVIGRFTASGSLSVVSGAGATSGLLRSLVASTGQPIYFYAQARPTTLRVRNNPMLMGVVNGTTSQNVYSTFDQSTGLSASSATSGTGLTLASGTAGSSFDAFEVLVYEGGVSAQTIADLRAYAISAYGLRSTPYTHNVVFEGDSITAGISTAANAMVLANSYPAQILRTATEDWKISNLGVSGSTTAGATNSLTVRAPATNAYYDGACTLNTLLGMIGRNDAVAGDSAATIYANIKTYSAARKAAGFTVWWGTCIATSSSSVNTTLQTLNGLLRGAANGGTGPGIVADAGVAQLVDFGALPEFDQLADANNTTYYQADGTHPNSAGAKKMADLVAPLLIAASAADVPAPGTAPTTPIRTAVKIAGVPRLIVPRRDVGNTGVALGLTQGGRADQRTPVTLTAAASAGIGVSGGSLTVASSTTYTNIDFTDVGIVIPNGTHDVTFQSCYWGPRSAATPLFGIFQTQGAVSNISVLDCTIDGATQDPNYPMPYLYNSTTASGGTVPASMSGLTVRRCNIFHTNDAFALSNITDGLIADNYVHDLTVDKHNDSASGYTNPGLWAHSDAVQFYSSLTRVLITRNNFDIGSSGPNSSGLQVGAFPSGGGTLTNVEFSYNRCDGGSYFFNANTSQPITVSGYFRVRRNMLLPGNVTSGVRTASFNTLVTDYTGNIWALAGTTGYGASVTAGQPA